MTWLTMISSRCQQQQKTKTMSNYDYLAVADVSEILDAHTKVMRKAREEGNKNLALTMASVTAYSFNELVTAIKTLCSNYPEIKGLLNKQIEDTRTAESRERQKEFQQFGYLPVIKPQDSYQMPGKYRIL